MAAFTKYIAQQFNYPYPVAPDVEMTIRIAMGNGVFDRRSFNMFTDHIDTTNTVIEIGAHVGSWSIALAKTFNRVVCFEPEPTTRAYLIDNIQRLCQTDNIEVIPKAILSRADLTKEFKMRGGLYTRNTGMAHLVDKSHACDTDFDIDTCTLDDFCFHHVNETESISGIKVDIEGLELSALKSGVETIQSHTPTILLEINSTCVRYGISDADIRLFLSEIGYHQTAQHKCDYIFQPRV